MSESVNAGPSGLSLGTMQSSDAVQRAAGLRLMTFDVDGVLTDGGLFYGSEGEALKRFSVLDGHGLKMLQRAGIRVALLSGRKSAIVARRAEELRVDAVLQGIEDKQAAFRSLLAEQGVPASEAGFMGDDLPDLPPMRLAGFAASVPGSPAYVRREAHWVATLGGGHGAVRECCDFILHAQGKWTELTLA
jgi:3-deoxy-D-manno-octulosonate 8-phosphate phosphatase (KDO 8-P phosphatase)